MELLILVILLFYLIYFIFNVSTENLDEFEILVSNVNEDELSSAIDKEKLIN